MQSKFGDGELFDNLREICQPEWTSRVESEQAEPQQSAACRPHLKFQGCAWEAACLISEQIEIRHADVLPITSASENILACCA